MSNVKERVRLTTTEQAVAQAKDISEMLHGPEGTISVQQQDAEMTLPPELGRLIQKVIDVVADGGSVTINAVPEELTTTTAAAILGVSRPTLMKMIQAGEIAAHKVGTHHRLATADVYAALAARRDRERAAFEALLDIGD